ncbi:hypothetical protein KAFR_0D04430 [Kazachstania africana CBS 2517]|uniref:Uncharacterized protein n=1 Tax=Kazachstania africana (strain ATCC 22294 / BCRC 22015 / CBS 2517 / CECT 1963 / NBRC 1671 / NRRL Y-8276) TaxID=1071382 RepID=H2AUP1_KAZAF|nr:hypothetical protein KAFR_0D04430 [Kazachstania africana CBS 2517]CCF58091.1 hypothetical protein KAFR_0D04430 [Kazachstania africana CBS 2517]
MMADARDENASMLVHRSRFVDYTPSNITSVAFSHRSTTKNVTPSDLRLAIGRSNGNIEIWNPRNDYIQERVLFGGVNRSIEGLVWCNVSGEPLRLFSIGGSTVITEWDLASGLPLKNYDCNAGVIWSIAINESQDKLAVGCDNGTVVIVDISGGKGFMEHDLILVRQEARILSLCWNHDDFVIGGCSDGRVRVWSAKPKDLNRGRLLNTMKVDKSKRESTLVWSVLYLPASNQIVSGDSTGSVKFWDFQFSTLVQSFKTHEADVLCLSTDVTNSMIFSAGVDRKIFQYSHMSSSNKKNSKSWISTSNRLLHGNDVRALCSYQSKGAEFLISAGLEKTFVVSSLSSFADGSYRKIPFVAPFTKNVLVNKEQRLVVMWNENIIKIWKIGTDTNDERNYSLVCKLTLKDEQNISCCAMSPDGQVLVVGRTNTTKLFHLQPTGQKLKVTKLENDLLLKTGSKLIKFVDNSKIILCSIDDEILRMDLEADDDERFDEIELLEAPSTKSSIKVPYLNNVNNLEVSGTYAVYSRYCGTVDLIDLATNKVNSMVRLTNFITSVQINESRSTVLVVTAENKIYELNINKSTNSLQDENVDESLLSAWSKNNTENLPKQLQYSKDKCVGIFIDGQDMNKVWFWGATWIASLDFSKDLPISKRRKPKKRSHDSLTITDDSNFMNYNDEEDDIDMEFTENASILLDKANNNGGTSNKARDIGDSQAFFFTDKYKPILFTDSISENELVIVERPALMVTSQEKSYALPKLVF